MRLFGAKKSGLHSDGAADVNEPGPEHPQHLLIDEQTGLLTPWYLRMRADEEVVRADRFLRDLSITVCMPQVLPGDDGRAAVTSAGKRIRPLIRDVDFAGYIDDAIAIVLLETPEDGANVLAQRLRSELGLRGSHIGALIWLVGSSSYPNQGQDFDTLLTAARAAAASSRRAAVS